MNKNELDVFIKWILGGLVVLGAIYFFPWGDITWGRIVLKNEGVVTVTGYAESQVKNQIAMFSASVESFADTKDKAVNEVNSKMTELIKSLKVFGVEEKDLKTQNMSVYQRQEEVPTIMMDSYPGAPRKIVGGQWVASNSVSITLRDVSKASDLANILNKSGATNVYGPNFQLDTAKKDDAELTAKAVADARAKAEKMAEASGAKLGRVVSISESGSSYPVPYYGMMETRKTNMALDVSAPAEPGSTTTTKTVTVVFGLR